MVTDFFGMEVKHTKCFLGLIRHFTSTDAHVVIIARVTRRVILKLFSFYISSSNYESFISVFRLVSVK